VVRPKIYRLLESPAVYSLVQYIIAPGLKRLRGKVFKKLFGNSSGKVLDIGCGPELITPVSCGIVVGVDINLEYIKRYTGEKVNLTKLGIVSSAENLPFKDKLFDESRCISVLHHLPTKTARAVIREMVRCVRPGGSIVIVDNAWQPNPILRPIPWIIRHFDRGEWIRHEKELEGLVKSSFHGQWQSFRFTYTYYGANGMIFTLKKPEVPDNGLNDVCIKPYKRVRPF
jgi:ubiquinone/menaquinone biosynthesis C-methylase UbiE